MHGIFNDITVTIMTIISLPEIITAFFVHKQLNILAINRNASFNSIQLNKFFITRATVVPFQSICIVSR